MNNKPDPFDCIIAVDPPNKFLRHPIAKNKPKPKKLTPHEKAVERKMRKWAAKQKAKQFVRPKWSEYIVSNRWKKKRRKFIKLAGNKCERCGVPGPFEVHHKHYRTLGREGKQDVEVLCHPCHNQEHEKDGVDLDDPISQQFRAIIG